MAYSTPAFLFLGWLAYLYPEFAQALLVGWLLLLARRL